MLEPLFEFSRQHCIAICAFLVPANLLATLQTILLIGFQHSPARIRLMVAVASLYALVMIVHVATWFMVGVVMVPTYVLMSLGGICLGMNAWAIAYPNHLRRLLWGIWSVLLSTYRRFRTEIQSFAQD